MNSLYTWAKNEFFLIRARLRGLISRGVVKMTDDTPKMQTIQATGLAGELFNAAERFQNYGLSSVPLAGAEALIVFVGADRSHPVVLAVDDRTCRPLGLSPGEVKIYTDEGDFIYLARGNITEISTGTLRISATAKVEVTAPDIKFSATNFDVQAGQNTIEGDTAISGSLAVTGDVTAGGVSSRTHVHPYSWSSDAGSGNTGAPAGG